MVATRNQTRTVCLTHKRSATELRQLAGKQIQQFCIYTVGVLLCYSLALRPMKIFFFYKDYLYFFTPLIPGGDQIFLILYCFKKACERERIHLMSKMLRKKLWRNSNGGHSKLVYLFLLFKAWTSHNCQQPVVCTTDRCLPDRLWYYYNYFYYYYKHHPQHYYHYN